MRSPFKKRSKPTASTASLSPLEKPRSHTEKIAYELSQTRQLLNRPGDQTTDWETAEKIVKSRVRKVLYCCHRPFIRLEKKAWEPLLAWANNQALLSLLGLAGNIGLIIAVTTYIASEKHRRNAEVLNAWQTITSAHGQAGSGGRIQALEFLNASPGANWRRKAPWICAPLSICLWPAEGLAGIDLSIDSENSVVAKSQSTLNEEAKVSERESGAYLRNIQLPKAALWDANLAGAYLGDANLAGAFLGDANLAGASLTDAHLAGAFLGGANLEDASLWNANLAGAFLGGVHLEDADLWDANLEDANLQGAHLEDADLKGASLKGVSLRDANLESVRNFTMQQLSQAKLCRTKLPEGIDLPPDRDCEELDPNNS